MELIKARQLCPHKLFGQGWGGPYDHCVDLQAGEADDAIHLSDCVQVAVVHVTIS